MYFEAGGVIIQRFKEKDECKARHTTNVPGKVVNNVEWM